MVVQEEQEEKVLLSADRLGRVAIVRRADGFFCLYAHWLWTVEMQQALSINAPRDQRWTTAYDPNLYYDYVHQIETRPVQGLYDTVESAELEARAILGLCDDQMPSDS